jgi:hypothetical protein
MHSKHIASLALALAAATMAGQAQAHDTRIQWAVTIGGPVLAIPLPPPPPLPVVVVRPRHEVVLVPAPVVAQRPVYGHHHGWRDSDRDGIPDRYDRVDNRRAPAWDRDGDGIPNRYDRYDNRHDNRFDHRRDNRRDGWQGR